MPGYFQIPLNLPHAATISVRVAQRLSQLVPPGKDSKALKLANDVCAELTPYRLIPEDPDPAESMVVQAHVLDLARKLVVEIEQENRRSDRLGQSIRNLFECLGRGEEGAQMGLRAGEDPKSIQRP